jgi:hypothetical protein
MQNSKFVGVCMLLSSPIVSAAIVYHARVNGRYQFQADSFGNVRIMDTTTGYIKSAN